MYTHKPKVYCARGRRGDFSCLKDKDLFRIAKKNNVGIQAKTPRKEAYKTLLQKLNCKDDTCLVQYSKNPSLLALMRLLPKGPDTVRGWLSDSDINNIIKSYTVGKQKRVLDYVHLGTVPVDFQTTPKMHWRVTIENVLNAVSAGKKRLSLIINMDPSWKGGSHWVALFISIPDRSIEYFNSTGEAPPKRVQEFIRDVQTKIPGVQFTVRVNRVQHQFADTECGMYSVIYVIKRLNGKTFDSITKRVILDDTINKCRSVYFRNYKNKVTITKGLCG